MPDHAGLSDRRACVDTCANRQTLKCLTIVDEWTRECLADGAGGIRSGRVIEILAQLVGAVALLEFLFHFRQIHKGTSNDDSQTVSSDELQVRGRQRMDRH